MTGYTLVNILGGLLIVTSMLVVLSKTPTRAAYVYAVQSLVLVTLFVALGTVTGSSELYTWAGTAFVTKVLVVPGIILYACKKMGDAGAGLSPKLTPGRASPSSPWKCSCASSWCRAWRCRRPSR